MDPDPWKKIRFGSDLVRFQHPILLFKRLWLEHHFQEH